MRIICPNCESHFEIESDLITAPGQDVQCSTCNTVWFQKPNAPVKLSQAQAVNIDEAPHIHIDDVELQEAKLVEFPNRTVQNDVTDADIVEDASSHSFADSTTTGTPTIDPDILRQIREAVSSELVEKQPHFRKLAEANRAPIKPNIKKTHSYSDVDVDVDVEPSISTSKKKTEPTAIKPSHAQSEHTHTASDIHADIAKEADPQVIDVNSGVSQKVVAAEETKHEGMDVKTTATVDEANIHENKISAQALTWRQRNRPYMVGIVFAGFISIMAFAAYNMTDALKIHFPEYTSELDNYHTRIDQMHTYISNKWNEYVPSSNSE